MIRQNFLLLFIFLFVTLSCTNNVIRRTDRGMTPREAPRKFFSGVKKKIILLNYFNEAPYGGEDLGIIATEELKKEIQRSGLFIIDTMNTKLFGNSKEVYAGGGVKLVQLSRKAKTIGINFVIFGRIIDARVREKTDEIGLVRETKSYTEAKVEVRIFDVNSNKEIYTQTLKGYADDSAFRLFNSNREEFLLYRRNLLRYSVRVAIRKAIPEILNVSEKLDWVGRVARIIGSKIYVNAGRKSGINIGDILKVISPALRERNRYILKLFEKVSSKMSIGIKIPTTEVI